MPIPTTEDFETSARAAKMRLAVSCDPIEIIFQGKVRAIEIMMPVYGDAYAVYRGTHIRLAGYKVPSSIIDGVRRWKPFQ